MGGDRRILCLHLFLSLPLLEDAFLYFLGGNFYAVFIFKKGLLRKKKTLL